MLLEVYKFSQNTINLIIFTDLIICLILALEFYYQMVNYDKGKNDFVKKNWVDLIAFIPFDFFFFRMFRFIKFFKLLRFIKILALIKKNIKVVTRFIKVAYLDKLLFLVVLIIIFSTLLLYLVDSSFKNIFTSFWFVITTVTTVGYGDIVPTTPQGKVIGVLLMIVGILFFTIFVASISSAYFYRLKNQGLVEDITNEKTIKKVLDLEKELKTTNNNIKELEEKIDKLTKTINND